MNKIEILVNDLISVGKIEKFNVFFEIFKECFNTKDKEIFKYTDQFLNLVEEYLKFDSRPNQSMKRIFAKNFEMFFRFIRFSNNLPFFERYYKSYVKYKDLIPDELSKANLFQYFGYFFWMKNENEISIKYFNDSLDIANASGDTKAIPRRYTNLGFLYETIGDLDKAEYFYLEGLEFGKKYNSQTILKLSYDAMGRLNLARNNIQKAIEYFKESLSFFDLENNLDKVSVTSNLAACYLKINKEEKALKLYKSILNKWLKESNKLLYYSILGDSAVCYINLEKYEEAEKILLTTIEFSLKNNISENIVPNYLNLASIYLHKNEHNKSLSYLQKAEKLSDKEDKRSKSTIFRMKGKIYQTKKEYLKAINFFEKSYNLDKKMKNKIKMGNNLLSIVECYEKTENYKKSLEILKKYNQVKQEYFDEEKKRIKEITANPLIGIGNNKHYIFRENNSLVSRELSHKIGMPFIGKSPVMLKIINQAILMAGNPNASVLIRGESGTGKEIMAKLIHYSSPRERGPFIPINSASFTKGISQSALFGHKKGSFTGAIEKRVGYFEAANNGTIFFDEIGDMPLDIQSQLLRVLEEKEIHPIGYNQTIKINFRMITATNIDIYKLVEENKFRFDFLNRINTLELQIPSLRERKEDIPILIDYYLNDLSNKLKIKKPKISRSAIKNLCDYNYPGNIRELKNIIEKLVMFSDDKTIESDDVFLAQNNQVQCCENNNYTSLNLEENEIKLIIAALKETNNVKNKAAKLLGITPFSLLRRLKKYNLN